MVKKPIIIVFFCFLLFGACTNSFAKPSFQDTIGYFRTATVPQNVAYIDRIPIDTGTNVRGTDTLYRLMDMGNAPLSYYRKILKEICFDGNCRMLNVNIYWNLTGRYLGFELPPNEFLSKAEHTPFIGREYEQLHRILADSLSALGNLRYEELLPKPSLLEPADAVTRPTSKDVLAHVVPGAVFTTYSMWHLIYGQMQEDVVKATDSDLSAELLLDILNSPIPWDWTWGLDRLSFFPEAPTELKQRVLELVVSDSYNLASKAIACIPVQWFNDVDFQKNLWAKLDDVEYSLKPNLIQKISTSESPDKTVLTELARRLKEFNGALLNVSLKCLKNYATDNPEIRSEIELLAKHENPYVASQARKIIQELNSNQSGP